MVKCHMALPWWKRTRETRHARVNKDTTIQLAGGTSVQIKKNSLVSPVRKAYLPRDHRWADLYDETTEMVADTGHGFAKLNLEDVDW